MWKRLKRQDFSNSFFYENCELEPEQKPEPNRNLSKVGTGPVKIVTGYGFATFMDHGNTAYLAAGEPKGWQYDDHEDEIPEGFLHNRMVFSRPVRQTKF